MKPYKSLSIVLGLAATVACGGVDASDDAPADASVAVQEDARSSDLDPCELLTLADAAEAMGVSSSSVTTERPSEFQVDNDDLWMIGCLYNAETGAGRVVTLSVQLQRRHSEFEATRFIEEMGEQGLEASDVAGVGDQATWLASVHQLWARSGLHVVAISSIGSVTREEAVELTKKALERLS